MEKLCVKLENCFGIEKLDYEFDFSDDNVISVYARNGLMKTSFSKTFKKIQEGKKELIRDEIFGLNGVVNVKRDGIDVQKEDVFVIKSFENSYESDSITSLLVNDEVKARISRVLKLKDKFLKSLEKYSGLKQVKTLAGKKVYELEPTIISDFSFAENSFLLNINSFRCDLLEYNWAHVQYNTIFDDTVIKKIKSEDFQEKIDDFIIKSNEIYQDYGFLDKGNFTLPKLKNISKSLEKDRFFVKENYISLGSNLEIKTTDELNTKILEIEEKIKAVPVFQEIEKMLSDSKGMMLKDVIESNPDIIQFLKIDRLDQLKKCLWLSYIAAERVKFNELITEYENLEHEIDTVDLDDTPWRRALSIFEERFTVPYKMEVSNMKGAIIGESVPRVEFSFERNGDIVSLNRDQLENIDILSQGEKRALYLLNIIFDVERMRTENTEKIVIIDDIADSFDYKNKYAIVEYLYEMAQNNKFKLLIFSHNFDFYRTVSMRLGIKRQKRLCAETCGNQIILKQEKYQKQPFEFWKQHLNIVNVLALIPFTRNIIEYGEDNNIGNISGIESDYILLTNLLHRKEQTNQITFETLKKLYQNYLGTDQFDSRIILSDGIIDKLDEVADSITSENVDLEYKIVLAMAIRHRAENFMLDKISGYEGTITWKENRGQATGSSNEFLIHLSNSGNQTRELFNAYKQFGDNSKFRVLEEVNIMTPENIHINSFMYEPILDMDINELTKLYNNIKEI